MPTVWDPLHSNPILCWYSHHLDMCEIWPQSFCHQLVQSPVSHHHDCRCPGIKWSPGHLQFWCRPILNKYCCRCYLLYDLYWKFTFFFFIPEAGFGLQVLLLPVCTSIRQSVNPLLVHTITCDPSKPGSPSSDQRCKTPWLRSVLFWGDDWPWPSSSNFIWKSKFTPFRACPHHNSPIQPRITKFGPYVQNSLVKIPIHSSDALA